MSATVSEGAFYAYITKYALTAGIQRMIVIPAKTSAGMVHTPDLRQYFHGEGKAWHRTLEGARKRAEEMRRAKISSTRKKLAQLERLDFSFSV